MADGDALPQVDAVAPGDAGDVAPQDDEAQQPTRKKKQVNWFDVSCLMALMAPGSWFFLWVSEALSRLWWPLGLFSYLMVALFAGLLLYAGRSNAAKAVKGDNTALVLGNGLVLIVCYSQIIRHLYIVFGGFQAADVSYWTWFRYNLINVFLGILRNIPATYDWMLKAPIVPNAIWSQAAMLLFTTLMDAMLTVTLWRALVETARDWRRGFYHRAYRSYWHLLLSGSGRLLVAAIWLLPLSFLVGGMVQGVITAGAWWSAVKVLTPMLLAGLVVWKSVQGLVVLPQWQKVWAAVGACAAGWYLYSHWWLWGSMVLK